MKTFEDYYTEVAKKYVVISKSDLHKAVTENMLNDIASKIEEQDKKIQFIMENTNKIVETESNYTIVKSLKKLYDERNMEKH